MYIFIACVAMFIVAVISCVGHMPLFKLNEAEMNRICERGLIHFTSKSSSAKVLKDGFKGKISIMGWPESVLGPLTWLYISGNKDTINSKHNILLKKKKGKDNPDNYGICLHIMGISEADLSCMVVRRGLWRDLAVVYKGELFKPPNISIIMDYTEGKN